MISLSQEQIDSFRSFVDSHDFFIIAGHKEPDGDCVSSCLGISFILNHLNKKYALINSGPFKRTEIKQFASKFSDQKPSLSAIQKNALIIVDCSEHERLGDVGEGLENLDTFIVDHHKTAEVKGKKAIIDPSAPAAALLVQQLFEAIVGKPSPEEAHAIFFGIATDTGFFHYLNQLDSSVFEAAARLTDAGVNPRNVYQEMSDGKPWNTRKLLAILLDRAKRYCNGKLVVTYEEQADTRRYGQEGRDSDALYSLMLSTEGVEAVVFLRQESDTKCTAGFRSLNDCDVSVIASGLGGGGHKNASGASIEGRLEQIIPHIVQEFEKIL
ncbi:MAG: bifunctional oligoribonuclease/PAP phosphatase NrnA [Treponema sp.]|nr:bifunctional oligoribonuclease/PAP phosphatase NrnA [Treponema sp.]